MKRKRTLLQDLIFIFLLASTSAEDLQTDYILIFDAGSTGTRVFVYSFEALDANSVPKIKQEGANTDGPPIDSFLPKHKQHMAGKGLKPLTDYAKNVLFGLWDLQGMSEDKKIEALKNVPLFLKATAGMRLSTSPSDTEAVMNSLAKFFHEESGFRFMEAEVIPGEDEGVFGWIAANYLLGTFHDDEQKLSKNGSLSPHESSTFGHVEMGGASSQITFTPFGNIIGNSYPVSITDTLTYTVYTHSFLEFGCNRMMSRHTDPMLKSSSPAASPCWPKGFAFKNRVQGTGNFHECRDKLKPLLLLDDEHCLEGHCTINRNYLPEVYVKKHEKKFVASTVFFYVLRDMNMLQDGVFSGKISDIIAMGEKFCAMEFEEMMKATNAKIEPEHICFKAAAAVSLLVDAFHFPTDKEDLMYFLMKLKKVNTEWVLGAALYEHGKLRSSTCPKCPEQGKISQENEGSSCNKLGANSLQKLLPVFVLFIVIM